MMTLLSMAAVVAAAILGWSLYRRLGNDRITDFNERRRKASRLVGTGEFVDGNRHLLVALALTDSTFFYENADMQASIDLQWVQEIEYSDDLQTGAPVHGGRVLRLRTHSQSFEFVLPKETAAKWEAMLPPHGGESATPSSSASSASAVSA